MPIKGIAILMMSISRRINDNYIYDHSMGVNMWLKTFDLRMINGENYYIMKYNWLTLSSSIIKIIVFILLLFAMEGQSSSYYVTQRFILFVLLISLFTLDTIRGRIYSKFIWIPFATFFNPFIPIYFQEFDIWKNLDAFILIITIFSFLFNDIFTINDPWKIAHYIKYLEFKQRVYCINNLIQETKDYFDIQDEKGGQMDDKERKMYIKISKELVEILIYYLKGMPEEVELYIMKGIIRSRLYHYEFATMDFNYAKKLNNSIRIPEQDEIRKTNFKNYHKKFFVSDN